MLLILKLLHCQECYVTEKRLKQCDSDTAMISLAGTIPLVRGNIAFGDTKLITN